MLSWKITERKLITKDLTIKKNWTKAQNYFN